MSAPNDATCTTCGCTDSRACAGGCSWLHVDRDARIGLCSNCAPAIDTGDTVRHEPSGEDWLVAFVEDGRLCACGWPCSFVPVADCTLIEKTTAGKRVELIRHMAAMTGDDPRKAFALRMLAANSGAAQ